MSNVDDRFARVLSDAADLKAMKADIQALKGPGGGGTSGSGMSDRVTRLEVQMEHVDRTLTSIDGKLDRVNERLTALPTRADLRSWQWQWIATGVGIIALTIGGITGGLALIAKFAG